MEITILFLMIFFLAIPKFVRYGIVRYLSDEGSLCEAFFQDDECDFNATVNIISKPFDLRFGVL